MNDADEIRDAFRVVARRLRSIALVDSAYPDKVKAFLALSPELENVPIREERFPVVQAQRS